MSFIHASEQPKKSRSFGGLAVKLAFYGGLVAAGMAARPHAEGYARHMMGRYGIGGTVPLVQTYRPADVNIQAPSVKPSEIEQRLLDLEGNGQNELYLIHAPSKQRLALLFRDGKFEAKAAEAKQGIEYR